MYAPAQIETLVTLYLDGANRDKLDPILDVCVAVYKERLDEDGQVDFKAKAKSFTRTYDFLASILPYSNADWEKLSIFLNFLISKLPAPKDEDLPKGILEAIDMDSYRSEKKAAMRIALPDSDAEIDPASIGGGGRKPEPELDAALMRVIGPLLKDDTEFYKQFVQNESFRRFVTDAVQGLASQAP